jgi:hypothetical protein
VRSANRYDGDNTEDECGFCDPEVHKSGRLELLHPYAEFLVERHGMTYFYRFECLFQKLDEPCNTLNSEIRCLS